MVQITILPEFGFVIGSIILSIFLIKWMAFKVGMARKKFEVPYPKMYSEHEDRFNCVQRAHQNTLEDYPIFLILTLISGLYAPKVSAVSALIWILGRYMYAKGYYTFEPEKRKWGSFNYIGLLTMLVYCVMFALSLLGWARF